MARDYKSRAHPKPNKSQTQGWVWFITGVLVGLFAAGLAWLKLGPSADHTVQQPPAAIAGPKREKPKAAPKKDQQPLPPKPLFEFYTILPDREDIVPEPEPEFKPQKKAQTPSSAPAVAKSASTAGTAYMLQMGSFRKYEDADRMKAGLALLGIEAEVQKVNINNQDTFHRVRSGPYRSSQQINQTRARLRQNKINTLLIKLKQ